MITSAAKEQFEHDGYVVIEDFFSNFLMSEIRDEINKIGKFIIGKDFEFSTYDEKLISPQKQSQLYDRLHYLPSLSRLSGNTQLLEVCQQFGIQLPVLMGCCNMRYDRPNDATHLFDWHQDSIYLLGSVNAVTAWIPFGKVDEHHGTIQVVAGSHRQGILPFKKVSNKEIVEYRQFLQRDLAIDIATFDSPMTIHAKAGDLILFKQMLLHRSLPNCSDKVRWTAQVRISDLTAPGFLEAGCPTGDKKNIFFQNYPGFKHPLSQ